MSISTPLGHMPLIASDRVRLDELRPQAQAFGKMFGMTVKLVRFSNREELETYEP